MSFPSRILLGVTGGIAAYKTPGLVRLLKKEGADVRVVLSKHAEAFVTPLTLQAVSGHPVWSDLFDAESKAAMDHIELARWPNLILIAPATANRIAALRMGLADDLLSTLCLASDAAIVLAPAMNAKMWSHPATQDNLQVLISRGVKVLGPAWGEQACGEVGLGRMLEPEAICEALYREYLAAQTEASSRLAGLNILITAGPTREPIDPVRFLSNRSSGKMGFALAEAAVKQGANVKLVAGPVQLKTPLSVERIDVETASEMLDAVLTLQNQGCDIFISCAAVSDYAPVHRESQKIKKQNQAEWELTLEQTPDILSTVSKQTSNRPFCVGFAAETEKGLKFSEEKRIRKQLDMIALNIVSEPGVGFDAETNALTVLWEKGQCVLPLASKVTIASQLLDLVRQQYYEKNSA
ncbi:MAG: bifunctional phosphopantothenoylcysteine decarboxylase/phosphopantothenate--cysteine ligase CoaBC [Gammaproteobacteria bacterium]